jgi:signal transduction histidine kinase
VNEEVLAAAVASGDAQGLAGAIRAWAADVRERGGDLLALADALSPLALHDDDRVRREVADAADLFSDSLFDHVLGLLAQDQDGYVRVAIERTAKRRAAERTRRQKEKGEERVLEGQLEEIATTYDAQARRMAERAGRRMAELYVRRLQHELSKVMGPLEVSLGRIRGGAGGERGARAGTTGEEIDAALGRVRYLEGMLHRALAATKTVKTRLRDEPVRDIVEAARGQLADRLGERGARVEVRIDVDPALRAQLDRAAMLQALQNLMQNAVEAYRADAERLVVSVSARMLRLGSELEIVVADEGLGMDEEQQAKRLVPLESTKGRGSGFGLLVVRNAIEDAHGGTVTV